MGDVIDFLDWARRLKGDVWRADRQNRLWRNARVTAPPKLVCYFPDVPMDIQ